jgi:GNAT superfamily N-acetyltransferase
METLFASAARATALRSRPPRAQAVLRLRALRPADVPAVLRFLERIDPHDLRLRFHATVSRRSERLATELARHDGRSRLALAVVAARAGRADEVLAVMNVACSEGCAEWALLVRSDLKGRGLGTFLLDELLRRAPRLGVTSLHAETLADNHRLLALARRFGHTPRPSSDGAVGLARQILREDVAALPDALAAAGVAPTPAALQ